MPLSTPKSAELQPNNLKALTVLADAEVKLSQWQEAEAVFERILAIKKTTLTRCWDRALQLGDEGLRVRSFHTWILVAAGSDAGTRAFLSFPKPMLAWDEQRMLNTRQACTI